MAKEVKQTTPTEQAAETAVKPVIKKPRLSE